MLPFLVSEGYGEVYCMGSLSLKASRCLTVSKREKRSALWRSAEAFSCDAREQCLSTGWCRSLANNVSEMSCCSGEMEDGKLMRNIEFCRKYCSLAIGTA